jgi:hypothetical protein
LDGFLPGLKTIDHLLLRKNAEALTRLSSLFKLPTLMLGEEGSFRGNFFRKSPTMRATPPGSSATHQAHGMSRSFATLSHSRAEGG